MEEGAGNRRCCCIEDSREICRRGEGRVVYIQKIDEPSTAISHTRLPQKNTPRFSLLPQTIDRRSPSTLHASRSEPRSTGWPIEDHLHSSNAAGSPPRPFGYPRLTQRTSAAAVGSCELRPPRRTGQTSPSTVLSENRDPQLDTSLCGPWWRDFQTSSFLSSSIIP